jgi:hypothetical protein
MVLPSYSIQVVRMTVDTFMYLASMHELAWLVLGW